MSAIGANIAGRFQYNPTLPSLMNGVNIWGAAAPTVGHAPAAAAISEPSSSYLDWECYRNPRGCVQALNMTDINEVNKYLDVSIFVPENPAAAEVDKMLQALSFQLFGAALQIVLFCILQNTPALCPSLKEALSAGMTMIKNVIINAPKTLSKYKLTSEVGGIISALIRHTHAMYAVLSFLSREGSRLVMEQMGYNGPANQSPYLDNAISTLMEASRQVGERRRQLGWELSEIHLLSSVENECAPAPLYHLWDHVGMRYDVIRRVIRQLIDAGLQRPVLVEVGVYLGNFGEHLLKEFPTLTWIGVDPYHNTEFGPDSEQNKFLDMLHEPVATEFKQKFGDRAKLMRFTSSDALKYFDDASVDIVFIDGDHRYEHVKHDVMEWTKKVRPGGVVSGHDFSYEWPGTIKALCEIRGNKSLHLGMDAVWWWFEGLEDE